MKRYLLPALLIGVLSITCNKNEKYNDAVITIEGFLLTDANGNPVMSWGNTADDWKLFEWNSLSTIEQSFLSFSDNIAVSNPTIPTIYPPAAYPNPFNDVASIMFRSDGPVKVKLAVVDNKGTFIKKEAFAIDGTHTLYLDFSTFPGTAPFRSDFRYYYSFSVEGNPHFKVGYGDVRLCRTTGQNPQLSDCFN